MGGVVEAQYVFSEFFKEENRVLFGKITLRIKKKKSLILDYKNVPDYTYLKEEKPMSLTGSQCQLSFNSFLTKKEYFVFQIWRVYQGACPR